MQCIHVSAIWKFNNHVGKKAMHTSRTKDICVLSLWTLKSEVREGAFLIFLSLSSTGPGFSLGLLQPKVEGPEVMVSN